MSTELAATGAAEQAARDALGTAPGTAGLAGAVFERVPGGFSNFAWRVTGPDGTSRFVRLAAEQVERLGADHVNECRVLVLAAAAGWAPPTIRCDPHARLLVTQWIDVAPSDEGRRPPPDRLRRLARLVAGLHASTPPSDVRVVDFGAQASELVRVASPAGRADERLLALASVAFERLRDGAPRVLCHHDLAPANILWDRTGRPWLVDWEYAGLGDAAFDLASLASQHRLDARGRARMLAHYRAAGGAMDEARLARAGWAFDCVQWLWYRASAANGLGSAGSGAALDRARTLQASLQARATRVLRCNNARFES